MSGINTVGDIPKAWRDLFALIKDHVGGVIMAGGCLRDRDNGVRVNDIDLFVPQTTGSEKDVTSLVPLLLSLGAQRAEVVNDRMYPEGVDNRIIGVVEAKFVSCPLVLQFVVGDWGVGIPDLFHRFDYGICMIAYDGKQIHRSPEYFTDQKAKLFRLCTPRSRSAFQKSVMRYAKLLPKYPGWKFDLGHFHAQYGGHSGGLVGRDGDITAHIDMFGVTNMQQAFGRLHRPVFAKQLSHIDSNGVNHFVDVSTIGSVRG